MSQQEIIEQLKALIKGFASREASITFQFFLDKKQEIIQIIRFNPAVQDVDDFTLSSYFEIAAKEYKSVYPIDIDPSTSLTRKGFETWLTDERKKVLPNDYLNRYLTYSRHEGRAENVILELGRSSEEILSKLGDPQSNSGFYTKGLVVGSVQSGKTGNFNAVINRAVDSGYNLIVILSGIMEDLRVQTQLRIEMDVIGEGVTNVQTDHQGVKGVGKVSRFGVQGNSEIVQVFSITSHKSDFKRTIQDANFSLNNKNILVCKKNTGVLKNLLIWLSDFLLHESDQHNIPLLIIDDEADNASLNNLGHKGREYASTINGHIRAILELFSRKTYLGYTASPFANVLQDRNEEAAGLWNISYKRNGEQITKGFRQVKNIFPDDFIELLNTPSNYIGAKQIFETSTDLYLKKIPLVEAIYDCFESFPLKLVDTSNGSRPATLSEIDDCLSSVRSPKKGDLFPTHLPDSLIDAIDCFVLSIAIRLKRRPYMAGSKLYNPHNTMLIHVSRFTEWQNRTRDLVQIQIEALVGRIRTELPSSANSIYARLEKIWNKYYAAIIENIRTYLPEEYSDEFLGPVSFEDIKPLLPEACKGIEIKAINSITKEKLMYSIDSSGNGKKYIAIGGNRLSRGFTLEGLSINYFIRTTNYADTLLQMGRWFGYRPGYIDCCKLFTTSESIEKYNAVTRTIEELELEFKKMHRLGKTPEDFILRVRTHPGVLKITRPSILKNTEEVNWSYQDRLEQTTQFVMNSSRIDNAWHQIKNLFRKYSGMFQSRDGFYFLETDIFGLFSFLDCSNTFHESDIEQIKAFVSLCNEQKKLKRWRIAVKATGSGTELSAEETFLPGNVSMSVRSGPNTGPYRDKLLQEGVFTGSGKSANIVSSGLDMALWLEKEEIRQAEKEFIASKFEEFRSGGMDIEKAEKEAKKKTIPESVYREKMNEDSGLLIIYLIDIRKVLPDQDIRLNNFKLEKNINDSIPLIGYAIGFPPMSAQIGGTYVRGRYNIEEDEPESEDFDDETLNSEE